MTGLPWDHPDPFQLDLEVARNDIDVLQHANNTAYLRWLERVAWGHTVSLGLDWEAYQRLGVACVVRRHELDYLAATYAGEQLTAATWVSANDRRLSLWRKFQIIRPSDRKTVLRGLSHYVCVRLDNGRPCRMPPEFADGYRVMIDS